MKKWIALAALLGVFSMVAAGCGSDEETVSYTHLTLPTILLV